MKQKVFWVLLGINALILAIVATFFFVGLADKSVSLSNIGIWMAIGVALIVIIGGGLLLKAAGHTVFGSMLLMLLALPGILYGVFIITVLVTGSSWN